MQGVGPGSVLGGRYVVTLRTSEGAHHERWRASDHTLEREVVVVVFPSGSAVAAPVLDAARRAAGLEDARLVRVLDVGSDGGVGFIVEEPLTGATPLSHLLQSGGLPADEVRRLVGEAASALDRAGHRGLHHLALSPSSVLRMPDGGVKVRGLATEAALTDTDRLTSEQAARADAVGLVRLAYAGLTGRWPAVTVDGGLVPPVRNVGLEPAPTIVGGVAAPSEIAAGVPNDLDLICRMTLGATGRGPLSPGDLALQIAPWPRESSASGGGSAFAHASEELHPTRVLPAVGAGAGATMAAGLGVGAADGPAGSDAGAAGALAGDASSPSSHDFFDRLSEARSGRPVPPRSETDTVPGIPVVGGAPSVDEELTAGSGQTVPAAGAAAASTADTGARGAAGLAAAGAAAAGVAGAIGDRVGSFARAAADKAAARAAERRAAHHEDFDGEDIDLVDALEEAPERRLEPPVPGIGGAGPEGPSGAQSRIALAIVGVLVLVALFVGINNVAKIGQHDGPAGADATVTVTKTRPPSSTGGETTTEAPPTTSEEPPPASAVSIVGGKGYDEQDGNEADQNVKNVYDGNPGTGWRSRWYGSATYNRGKDGLGVILDLSAPTALSEVVLTLPAGRPQDVTVYLTNGGSREGAQEVGTKKGAEGTVTLKPGSPLQPGSKLIVFVTKPAPDEAPNHYRAQILEVTVR